MKRALSLFAVSLSIGCSSAPPGPTPEDTPPCNPSAGTICTVAGTAVQGLLGDKGPAYKASLYWPMDVSLGPDGHLYIVDWNNHRIRRVDSKTEVIDTFAGTDDIGDGPDGPALETHFNHPTNIVFDNDGNMLMAAWHNSKVKTIDMKTGMIKDTCGDGRRAYFGDGGPAKTAAFDLPGALLVSPDGSLFILDQANQRIRIVDKTGVVHNYAGGTCMVNMCKDGEKPEACPNSQKMVCNLTMNIALCGAVPGCLGGFAGDDGPAADLTMAQPVAQSGDPGGRLAFDKDGNVYFSDNNNHRIRRIDAKTKIVTTVAGNGQKGYAGDGGKAADAKLNRPTDIAFGADGALYIADTFNSCIRRVKDGTIETFAGQCGKDGFSGDGGKPTEALLNRPYGLEIAPNGDVYVVDTFNGRVRVVKK
jgi:adhesin/invasin